MTARDTVRLLLSQYATLPWAYFCLMGLGLLLASYFLQVGKLTGSEWVTLCSVLFSADRAANAIGGLRQ